MFKNHPKGLIPAALSNLGERFGFYTMMAILVLFLQAKFNLGGKEAGVIYATFYFSIYILALVGGIIADVTRNFKATIIGGIVCMGVGYLMLSIPSGTPVPQNSYVMFLVITCVALFVIAFGNGLFKGNLQALIGQMYDDPKYEKMRDSGFSLFYMFINLGAIFAPIAAIKMREYWLATKGFIYSSDLPDLCHNVVDTNGNISGDALTNFLKLSGEATQNNIILGSPAEYVTFAKSYLNVFTEGFHYAFAVAIIAMAISLTIFLVNKKKFPNPKTKEKSALSSKDVQMGAAEIRQRMMALFAVFGVVIFFWFSFHQNGLTLTFFARDYTELSIFGMPITAELFQSLNPFFVVFLTPLVLWLFSWQRKRGVEPSTPKKIAIGMAVAASAFLLMAVSSAFIDFPLYGTIDPELGGTGTSLVKVGPWLLICTYFILTIAELYISPLGISFVSKVAPPKYQGIMQGGWLGATALGNQLLVIGAICYEEFPLWLTWTMFVVVCCISMTVMLVMLKWLERVTK